MKYKILDDFLNIKEKIYIFITKHVIEFNSLLTCQDFLRSQNNSGFDQLLTNLRICGHL